ncbi:glycine cleavage system protein T [Citrobacter amalonaticus]|jgi:hypothetical protein|uniref:glycine cleavage system protein T n=1 Tax=Citrobacter amalonaticus TaxID=35703 RepID=UPI00255B0513|nr:glycine cleavage system protein T [Citrobacter amalonaticus]MDL4617835.1 glycine cleavage system protein T [Citrobacter amalonaticus]MDL4621933.1 glycine cleavage system protein T [Citrobacter amalonaticus]
MKDVVLQSKLEMARTLYANGVSIYFILLATGLTWRELMAGLNDITRHQVIVEKGQR